MLRTNQGVSLFQEYPPQAPAIILSYVINIPLDILKTSYPELNPRIGAAKGTLIVRATEGYWK